MPVLQGARCDDITEGDCRYLAKEVLQGSLQIGRSYLKSPLRCAVQATLQIFLKQMCFPWALLPSQQNYRRSDHILWLWMLPHGQARDLCTAGCYLGRCIAHLQVRLQEFGALTTAKTIRLVGHQGQLGLVYPAC